VNWGDGLSDTYAYAGATSFQATHYYRKAGSYSIVGGVISQQGEAEGNYYATVPQTVAVTQGSVPLAPSNVLAAWTDKHQIGVTWRDNSDIEDGFVLQRRVDVASGGLWVTVPSFSGSANVTSYTDNSVDPNHTYEYQIKSVKGGASLAFAVSNLINTTLSMPTNLLC